MRARGRSSCLLALALSALALPIACATDSPVRGERRLAPIDEVLARGVAIEVTAGEGWQRVTPPDERERVLRLLRDALASALERRGIRVLDDATRAGAVLEARVSRWRERSGGDFGSTRPASVVFQLRLRGRLGAPLWEAVVDETQVAFSENLFASLAYPGGGLRWLRVDALGAWAAERAIEAMLRD